MSPYNVVVLLSGFGGNLQAIINAYDDEKIPGTLSAVISDKDDAYGLIRAQEHNIPAYALTPEPLEPREAYDQRLLVLLEDLNPNLVVLAGFMRILSPALVKRFAGKLINIHPALLPKYKGLRTHARALENKESEHGATVHFVTDDLDAGPIIAQAKVPVKPHDTPDTLAERVTYKEHKMYPQVIAWFAQGKVSLQGTSVILNGITLPPEGISLA